MFPQYEYRTAPIRISNRCTMHEYPTRFHRQLELSYVESGEYSVMIDGQNYTLCPGDLYIVFPNIPHACHASDSKGCLALIDPSLCPAFSDVLNHSKPQEPILRKSQLPPIVREILLRMLQLQQQESPYRQNAMTGYVNALLGELLNCMETVKRDSVNDLVMNLILYFQDNYTQEITLDSIARELNYSKYYLSHVISKTFQCNFRQLVNSYRSSMAQTLLLGSTKTVGEIAIACGFRNQSSFNRIFLQYAGMTPTQFRQQEGAEAGRI